MNPPLIKTSESEELLVEHEPTESTKSLPKPPTVPPPNTSLRIRTKLRPVTAENLTPTQTISLGQRPKSAEPDFSKVLQQIQNQPQRASLVTKEEESHQPFEYIYEDEIPEIKGCCGGLSFHWIYSSTFNLFWKTLLISSIILLPGLLLHFLYQYHFSGIDALVWFSAVAIVVFTFPFIQLILHIILYHVIPESLYNHKVFGGFFFYTAEISFYLATVLWLLLNFILWNFAFPIFTFPGIMSSYPLFYFNPIFGVLCLWTIALGLKKMCLLWLINRFNQSVYLERVRESLFMDFIVETLKEAKRRIKFLRKLEEESPDRIDSIRFRLNTELLKKIQKLAIPYSFLQNDDSPAPTQPENLTAHGWKRLLDHFYSIALQDEQTRSALEEEFEHSNDEPFLQTLQSNKEKHLQRSDTSAEAPKAQKYIKEHHHLHHYHYNKRQRRMNKRITDGYHYSDETSQKLAQKLFKILKREEVDHLDVCHDLIPLFEYKFQQQQQQKQSKGIRFSDLESKMEKISKAVLKYFLKLSDSGQLTEKTLREVIRRSFRERARLVASLSGMRIPIQKISDFLTLILYFFLILSTLSIFGIDAFGALLSLSSAVVSFAFLFGSSAKNAFEGIIFLFFTHPYDIGDRIFVDGQNYIVSKINLLSTLLERWDGQLIYVPNANMLKSDIYNLRRSNPQYETIVLGISFLTPNQKIFQIAEKMMEFTEQQSSDYARKVSANIDQFTNLETCVIKVSYGHKSNWQNWELYLQRRTKFYRKLVAVLKELEIQWLPLSKPMELQLDKNLNDFIRKSI